MDVAQEVFRHKEMTMEPKNIKPASKGTDDTYEPQGSGMDHDAFFASVAPGIANSGNLAHRSGAEGDHSISEAPVSMKGE